MKQLSIGALFLIGIFSTDILISNILNALFCVGKSKNNVKKMKKDYNVIQKYFCKYVVLPLEYNQKKARFFKVFREIHSILVIVLITLFFVATKGKGAEWFTILMYIKVFAIDLTIIVYVWWHSGRKFFSANMEDFDFSKKK